MFNNNINTLQNNEFDFPNISIGNVSLGGINDCENNVFNLKSGIDFIILTLLDSETELNSLFVFLNKISYTSNLNMRKHNKCVYDMGREYQIRYKNQNYRIVLNKSSIKPYLPILMRIDKPDKALLELLENTLRGFKYHVQSMELKLDFTGYNINKIYEFISSTFSIKYQGKDFNHDEYATTTYYGNPRYSKSKGGRVYNKNKQEPSKRSNLVRAEVNMKRRFLKGKKRAINNLQDVLEMKNDILTDVINLKIIDEKKLRKRLMKQGFENIETIINKISNICKKEGVKKANQAALKLFKQHKNYTYLITHPFDEEMKRALNNIVFLNNEKIQFSDNFLSI